jgi:lipoprotein Spr
MNLSWAVRFLCLILIASQVACSRNKKTTQKKASHRTEKSVNNHDALKSKYAKALGVEPKSITNISLYQFIDDWYGVPYKYGGTTKSGTDCSGFIGQLYSQVYNKSLPRTTSEIDKACSKVSKASLKEGDLVFFDINKKKSSHVGVYLQNDRFVHASTSKGVIISELSNPYYQKAFAKGGRK